METSRLVRVAACFSAFLSLGAFGQKKSDPAPVPPADSSITIITKVPFEGVNYFIKIVPMDPDQEMPMPMYNPERDRTFFWHDSLQRLFPDSLLKQFPRRRAPGKGR